MTPLLPRHPYLSLLSLSPLYEDTPSSSIPLPILVYASFGSVSLLLPPSTIGDAHLKILRNYTPLLFSPFPLDNSLDIK